MLIYERFNSFVHLQSEQSSLFRGLKPIYCSYNRVSYSNWDVTTRYDRVVFTHKIKENFLLKIKRK